MNCYLFVNVKVLEMWRKSKTNKSQTDFKADIPEYNDEEILEILKKRKYYQSEAVDLALEEAYKRELIYSEQDLFNEDFEHEPLKFGLFPNIEDEQNKNNIRKSIARGIFITGIFPVIWGFLRLNAGNPVEGGMLLILGILWMFLSANLIREYNLQMVNGLFSLAVLSVVYLVVFLLNASGIIFMDVFIIVALYGLLTYGLLFLRKLK